MKAEATIKLLLFPTVLMVIGCAFAEPTPIPTPTLSPEAQMYQLLEDIHGENVWGASIRYGGGPSDDYTLKPAIHMYACVGERVSERAVQEIAEDFVSMVMLSDTAKTRYYDIQLHRCNRDLHRSPSRLWHRVCIDTIAYGGHAGDVLGELSQGRGLRQTRGERGVHLDNSRLHGGEMICCGRFGDTTVQPCPVVWYDYTTRTFRVPQIK